jgi:aminoglycoside phosphotransferase (APT) family kinase protein
MTVSEVRVQGADPEVLAWVEATTGGVIASSRRLPRGRPAWILELEGSSPPRVVLKYQRAPADVMARYRFLSEFNLQREAVTLKALRQEGVAVPGVIGFHQGPDALLLECVDGTGDLARVPAGPERQGAMGEYARALAVVHQLDWSRLGLDQALPVPTAATHPTTHGPLGTSIADFQRFRSELRHPEPLLDLAIWWLQEHRPPKRDGVSLLHGDAGVNQFLVENGTMTTVLDWELSHLGDPMSDFGNARYREVLYPSGTFDTLLAEYAAHGGQPLDRRAIQYYTVGAATIMLLAIAVNVHRPRVKNPDSLSQLWWDDVTRVVLCDAIVEATGSEPVLLPDAWPTVDPSRESRTATFLVERLAAQQMSLEDPGQQATLHDSRLLAQVVQLEATYGAILETETLDDLEEVLRSRPASSPDGLAAVDELVREDPQSNLVPLVASFGRLARRRLRLVAPLADIDNWGAGAARSELAPVSLPSLPDWI